MQAYRDTSEKEERVILYEINSCDRDVVKYPQPTEFRYRFTYPLKDVQRVRLVSGTLPPIFNIDTPYNSFQYQLYTDLTSRTVTVEPGVYTLDALVAAVTAAMPDFTWAKMASGRLQVTHATQEFKLLFEGTPFTDYYDSINNTLVKIKGLARFLGFAFNGYKSSGRTLISPLAANPCATTSRLYLYINADSKYDIGTIDRGTGRRRPFAILYPDLYAANSIKYLNKEIYHPTFEMDTQPMSRISALDIELRDEYDYIVNTAGRELSLLLEFIVLD
jgi:hypothetical protein